MAVLFGASLTRRRLGMSEKKMYCQMKIGQKECLMYTANWFVNALDNEKNTQKI